MQNFLQKQMLFATSGLSLYLRGPNHAPNSCPNIRSYRSSMLVCLTLK